MDSTGPNLPPAKLTDQAGTDQVPVQQKQEPSSSVVKEISYILVNLYAPIIDKPSDQANFGAYIWDIAKVYPRHNIVIGGDFN